MLSLYIIRLTIRQLTVKLLDIVVVFLCFLLACCVAVVVVLSKVMYYNVDTCINVNISYSVT